MTILDLLHKVMYLYGYMCAYVCTYLFCLKIVQHFLGCLTFIIHYIEADVDTKSEYFEAHRSVETMLYIFNKYNSWYIHMMTRVVSY